jgi:hypothetical protein
MEAMIMVDIKDRAGVIYNLRRVGDLWGSLHPFVSGNAKMAFEW